MNFKEETSIRTPEVTYEIVVDFGDDGTQTIFSTTKESVANDMLDKFMIGDYSGLDFDKSDEDYVVGVSLKQTIEAPSSVVDVVTFGNEQQVFVELYSAKVVK